MTTGVMRQHLIDPDSCVRCGGCEMACPNSAIETIDGTLVIDPARCDGAGACIEPCQTGAINAWRYVHADNTYSMEEQATWLVLPEQNPALAETGETLRLQLPAPGFGPPASAPKPQLGFSSVHNPLRAIVRENRRLSAPHAASDIRHLVLDVGASGFQVLEGQSVGVVPPGLDASGKPHHVRLYSVANARDGENGQAHHIAFTVKRVVVDHEGKPHHGICSNFLCDLNAGDDVHLVGPYGASFLMPDDPDTRLLMICTGTGIAPMRGIIARRALAGTATRDRLMLFFGARTRDELPYLQDLEALAGTGLDLEIALSRAPDRPKAYVQDILLQRKKDVAELLADPRGHVYLCGLRGMEAGVLAAFELACTALGINWAHIHDAMKASGRIHFETY